MNQRSVHKLAGWLVFAIAFIVYFFSAERTGSLWDCGEFITGAYKLEVVHPPGAPLFLIVGRLFTFIAEIFSNNPEDIAFSVNMMSGICSAFTAMFICWVTMLLGKLTMVDREDDLTDGQQYALAGAGIAAGLATAFSTSIWFSAVEGEVYAMSTFFTALTLWAVIKWYSLPDKPDADRWLVFALYSAGLSIGVHLLSLLTFPALALFYYFKKFEKHTLLGMALAAIAGVGIIAFTQVFVIVGIPKLWAWLELQTVNGMGMGFNSGLIPLILIIAGLIFAGLRFAHQNKNQVMQLAVVGAMMVVVGFSTIGVIVIRANANPPINMNDPSDPMRLLPYLNREQYGERALLYGPWYGAQPYDNEFEPRYGQVGDKYEIVDDKISYKYQSRDMGFFPRMQDGSQSRPQLYEMWRDGEKGKPNFFENLGFMFRYQVGWMYWRYFMWNFAGRQNGEQGYYSWDPKSGNWYTGIKIIDEMRLYNEDELPDTIKNNQGRNRYFLLPFIFGVIGLIYQFQRRSSDALGLLAFFIITGIGIIVYSNQPPNEPRERDYVLVGSFFTFCIWIGMGALAIFDILRERMKNNGALPGIIASAIVLSAPIIMGFQNFDDHSRRHHKASRDYAANFLESCEENAIIFTYGDNDTYPLWYAQEVENIRRDVRVVNLSLIAVDWYINQLRRKVNDSAPLKLTIPADKIRGSNRNSVPYYNPKQPENGYQPELDPELDARRVLEILATDVIDRDDRRSPKTYLPTKRFYIPVNKQKAFQTGWVNPTDTGRVVDRIPIQINRNKNYLTKDELAVLDVIVSNLGERPIYFAVTCRPEKMLGLQDYMQMEGLGLRILPVKTPISNERRQYGSVYGAGRVAANKVYDRVMNKFAWGNFDERELFVDRSYGPSIQSLHILMLRTAETFVRQGNMEKAVDLAEKYLEVFPHMNFPYDYRTMRLLDVMVVAGAYEKAKPHLDILAEETLAHLRFYNSLDQDDLEAGFGQDFGLAMRTKDDLITAAERGGDAAFKQQLENMFVDFKIPAN